MDLPFQRTLLRVLLCRVGGPPPFRATIIHIMRPVADKLSHSRWYKISATS